MPKVLPTTPLPSQGKMPKSRKSKIQVPQRHPPTRTLQKKKRMSPVISLTERSRRRRTSRRSTKINRPATVLRRRPIRRQVHQLVLVPPLPSQRKQHPTSSLADHLRSSPEVAKPSSVAHSARVSMTLKAMALARRETGITDQPERAMLLQKEAEHSSTCPHQPKLAIIRGAQKRRRGQRDQLLSSRLSAERLT